jgi:hypothetical protein
MFSLAARDTGLMLQVVLEYFPFSDFQIDLLFKLTYEIVRTYCE